jgi:hypothetical protein
MMRVANIMHRIEISPSYDFILDDSPSVKYFLQHGFSSIHDFEMDKFQWLHVHDTTESDVIRPGEIPNWPGTFENARE